MDTPDPSVASSGTDPFYVTGGTLRADSPSYVERPADRQLLEALLSGDFCYVLTSRQMGKSSLMVRTADRLRAASILVVVLDLTALGQNLTPEQWYGGLLNRLGVQTGLEDALDSWWWDNETLGPCRRFFAAIEAVLLPRLAQGELLVQPAATPATAPPTAPPPGPSRCATRLVVFIDELDVVRSLHFSTDEFFAAIRECHTRRAEAPLMELLNFGLLGVATPSDLIRDTRMTPFNIGRRIELTDFEASEAMLLANALGKSGRRAGGILHRILYWTSGHPYLTQRLCRAVADDPSIQSARGVDRLCKEMFFSHRARERDDNLLFVRERLLRSEVDLAKLLHLYRQVHRSTRIASWFGNRITIRDKETVADEESNPLVAVLRLSGVSKVDNGRLRVRNRIYYKVFDPAWVDANMPPEALWQRWLVAWGFIKQVIKISLAVLFLGPFIGLAVALWSGVVELPWGGTERLRPRTSSSRPTPAVPPRPAGADVRQLDLTRFYNASLSETWHPGRTPNSLQALAPGLKTLGGVTFDVRGIIQLEAKPLLKSGFPGKVVGIPVRTRFKQIHFLHGAGWNSPEGTQIANYVFRYAGGNVRFAPVIYGQDAADWVDAGGPARATGLREVWRDQPTRGFAEQLPHRLFLMTWVNPLPELEVESIELVSAMGDSALFVVAITLD